MTDPAPHSGRTSALLHLRGLNIVDVVSADVKTKTSITMDGDRIVGVGTPKPGNATDLDLSGYWATPSLIDMHAHVTFESRAHDGVPFSYDESADLGAIRGIQNLTEALRNGICLIRDMGGKQESIARLKSHLGNGRLLLPELITSGEPLCLPGGHGSAFGRSVSSMDEAGILIARQADHGHEWLKIMNGPELWPSELLGRIVALAKESGLQVAVHAFTRDGIDAAVRSGADTVEHALLGEADLCRVARDSDTAFVPTAYCSLISLRPRFTLTQEQSEVELLKYWYEYLHQCRTTHIEQGLPMLPGTDAGCAPCSFDDYFEELVYFERWGLDPMTVLQAASIRAAECLGRSADFGSIEAGKLANLIVTDRDPTTDTGHLRHRLLVLYKGAGVLNALGAKWS